MLCGSDSLRGSSSAVGAERLVMELCKWSDLRMASVAHTEGPELWILFGTSYVDFLH